MDSLNKKQPLPNPNKKTAVHHHVQPKEKTTIPSTTPKPPSHRPENCGACNFYKREHGASKKLKQLEKWSLDPSTH